MMRRGVAVAALVWPVSLPAGVSGDITAAVRANQDIVLGGSATITLPSGTTTYTGVISGTGTLTVRGSGTLVLTRDSTFTLPPGRRHQKIVRSGGGHWYVTVSNPDDPAITVARGATLQYGDTSGPAGVIGAYPYGIPGYQLNQDNIRVDGTLRVATKNRAVSLGTISGTGLVSQPRSLWGGLILAGPQPFAGVIDNGTGIDFGEVYATLSLPSAGKILNQGSAILATPPGRDLVLRQNFYERYYGSDVNAHTWGTGTVVLAGQYSYIDPTRNWVPIAHHDNKRGTNIEGANVQWGDGTTHQIFMPGTKDTVYINLHARSGRRSRLTFAYDGPVKLGAPIGGGLYHDTLAAPGAGDIVIKGVRGNDVTFAAVQYYDGSTTIQRGAILRLGTGRAGEDGGLLTGGPLRRLIDEGTLVLNNTRTAITLPPFTGAGSIRQIGPAAVTIPGPLHSQGLVEYGGGAGQLTVKGALTQSGTVLARLGLGAKPLRVTGPVALHGRLRVAITGRPAAGTTSVVIDGRATGTFDGLPEGTVAAAGGRGYTVTYRDGRVALIATGKPAPAGAVSLDGSTGPASAGAGAQPPTYRASARAKSGHSRLWAVGAVGVLAAGGLAGVALLLIRGARTDASVQKSDH